MKTYELKPFQELPHTDQLTRLDWFGGVKYNLVEDDNPLIECIFTPFELTDPVYGESKLLPKRDKQFLAGFAVGYLPALSIGQNFRGGEWIPPDESNKLESITFHLDVSNSHSITECTLKDIPLLSPTSLISAQFWDTANRSGLKKLLGSISLSSNKKVNALITKKSESSPNKKASLPLTVLIHEIELVRFYLTNSSFSCKNIFTGAFSEKHLLDRVLNELHETAYLDEKTGKARFVYRHGYKEEDAASLGRILFEPNNLGLEAARRVHSSMTADRINIDPNWLGYPRTLFPFIGNTQLSLTGRRMILANGDFIFLVNRINSCNAAFPFKNLSFCDEMTPGGAAAPDDAPVAFSGQKTIDKGPAHSGENTVGVSTSSERPNSSSIQLQNELSEREYVGLAEVSIYKEKLRDSTYGSQKRPSRFLEELRNASTGRGTSGKSTSTRQSIKERVIAPSEFSADLKTFTLAVNELRNIEPDWKINFIIVGTGPNDGKQTSYFPEVPCQIRKHIMRQFSYIDDKKLSRRRLICVEIEVNGQFVYLFEAQRRFKEFTPSEGQSPYKEDMPIMRLHTHGFEKVLGNDFLPVLVETVKVTTWPNENLLNGFIKDITVHVLDTNELGDVSARIAQLVKRNLNTATDKCKN